MLMGIAIARITYLLSPSAPVPSLRKTNVNLPMDKSSSADDLTPTAKQTIPLRLMEAWSRLFSLVCGSVGLCSPCTNIYVLFFVVDVF
jgi:hypothetical protein